MLAIGARPFALIVVKYCICQTQPGASDSLHCMTVMMSAGIAGVLHAALLRLLAEEGGNRMRRAWEATIRPMPSSMSPVLTACVWLPSPDSTLARPTMQMPTCPPAILG